MGLPKIKPLKWIRTGYTDIEVEKMHKMYPKSMENPLKRKPQGKFYLAKSLCCGLSVWMIKFNYYLIQMTRLQLLAETTEI